MLRKRVVLRVAVAVVVGVAGVAGLVASAVAQGRDVDAFRGLGAWIDVFDYVPAFEQESGPVPVTPETIDDLAELGADTIYLQAAIDDPRAQGRIVHRRRVGRLLRRGHDLGLNVVAWYYPQLVEPDRDERMVEAILDFEWRDERFDAIALDIESTLVPEIEERNDRLVELVDRTRRAADDRAVGAIVYPAVQLEVINRALWPDFPYRRMAEDVDAWFPMTYWTFRDGQYRDAFTYTEESVRRLRSNLDDRDALVHPIGGLGALSVPEDYRGLLRAAREVDALGWSVYDADTIATTAWRFLRDD